MSFVLDNSVTMRWLFGDGKPQELAYAGRVLDAMQDVKALKHARMAQKDMKNPHLNEGAKHLEEAVAHGKQGHADVATQHAEQAVSHLNEVK